MIDVFKYYSDIYIKIVFEVFKVLVEEVILFMRSRVKVVNFGIVYGISVFSLV